jgi:excinuclease ABC subunit C
MLSAAGEVLYVGKARNLRKRVGSYFARGAHSGKTHAMLQRVAGIEVTVTHTENEALLLEDNLVKSLKPRYNILLRDDKSYPYIHISDHEFPRLGFHRGAQKGAVFRTLPPSCAREPRAAAEGVSGTPCEDSVFRNRSRPCLQYQIKRCTAPCVGYISAEAYARTCATPRCFWMAKVMR